MDNSLKERVLSSTDIVSLIGERVSLVRKGKDFVGLCPFHDDHKPSLSVSPAKQIFKCWSCGVGGDAIRYVQLSQRIEFGPALAVLAQRAGIDHRAAPDEAGSKGREELRRVNAWAREHFRRNLSSAEHGREATAYALKRGLTPETIETFGLGLALNSWRDLSDRARRAGVPEELLINAGLIVKSDEGSAYDRFRNRLIFPILDAQSRPVAFGGRTLGDDPAKYLNSPESPLFSKSRILYAFDQARDAMQKSRQVIVVEGYMDAVLLHQHGFANTVAALGTAMTEAHARLLTPYADTVVLCFDADAAGVRAADRAVETALRQKLDVRVAVMPDGEDPADSVLRLGSDGFRSILQSAVPALEFKWSQIAAAVRKSGDRGYREATSGFLAFVSRVASAGGIDPIEQGMLVSRLSELLRLSPESIYEALAADRRRGGRVGRSASPESAPPTSGYADSVRDIPAGLVSSVEELVGLILRESGDAGELDRVFASAAKHCPVWGRLADAIDALPPDRREEVRAALLEACDDADVLELLSRGSARVRSRTVNEEYARRVSERVQRELQDCEVARHVARGSAASGADADSASFLSVLDCSRRGGVFSLKHRVQPGIADPAPRERAERSGRG